MSFSDEYIASCIADGKTTPIDICAQAKKEISLLEIEAKKIEEIRAKQNDLRAVIRQLGESPKRAKKIPMVVDPLVTEEELDSYIREMCVSVCNFIEKNHPTKLKPREIMDGVASVEDNKIVLTSIKWLWDHGIIQREEGSLNREISKGKNWEKRPL